MRECQALNAFQIQVPSPTQSALEKLAIYAKMKLNVTVPKRVQVKDAHVKRHVMDTSITQKICNGVFYTDEKKLVKVRLFVCRN